MADKVIVSRSKIEAVADAIREKTATSEGLSLDVMPAAITNIPAGDYDEIYELVTGSPTIVGYKHSLRVNWDGGSYGELVIENDSPDDFDFDSFSAYLYDNGYNTYTDVLPASGLYYEPPRYTTSYAVLGFSSFSGFLFVRYTLSGGYSDLIEKNAATFEDTIEPIYE